MPAPHATMIIVLNGPLGIGKSTLAEALTESIDACVMLDGDRERAGDTELDSQQAPGPRPQHPSASSFEPWASAAYFRNQGEGAEVRTRSSPMSQASDDDQVARRRLLWDVSQERRAQGRHSETLRSTVTNYVLLASSGLVAVITSDRVVNRYDVALAILLILIGVLGVLFNATYTERYHRNRRRASQLLKALDDLSAVEGSLTIHDIEANADAEHLKHGRFRYVRRRASSHWLWLAFPTIVGILGAVLTVLAILRWSYDPPR
jgi:hypothetical protein